MLCMCCNFVYYMCSQTNSLLTILSGKNADFSMNMLTKGSCMLVFKNFCYFYHCDSCCRYYSGEKLAPVLTIFIGGNHEASNYLQELPYGRWVAPRISYMGYESVVNVAGVRVGGLSGIYKGHDYFKGHFEKPPYTEDTKRSVYHVRNLETFRLKQVICTLK